MKDQHKKISGYRDLTQEEIDLINECKELSSKVGDLCDKLALNELIDKRWLKEGQMEAQKAFMSLVRSISKPKTF